jgi:hypothetical protein
MATDPTLNAPAMTAMAWVVAIATSRIEMKAIITMLLRFCITEIPFTRLPLSAMQAKSQSILLNAKNL